MRASGDRKTVQMAPAAPNAQPQSRVVEIGIDDGTNAEVLKGLQEGDEVVTGTRTQKTQSQGGIPMMGGNRAMQMR